MVRIVSLLLAAAAVFGSEIPQTILDLQPFRQATSTHIRSGSGKQGTATLVNLNPAINAWYLLSVDWNEGSRGGAWHLENARPHAAKILLDESIPPES
jgi:hypothetical protein